MKTSMTAQCVGVLGVPRILDLSATPFFLSGSYYAEGTLFPGNMSDFSLMDAIECGIVKLRRMLVAENITGEEMGFAADDLAEVEIEAMNLSELLKDSACHDIAQSERLLEDAKRAVEIAIEQDEAAGMAYLAREGALV